MSNHSLTDDLDYLRTLAEAGETAPLLGGRFLVWWGALISLAYTGQYLILSGIAGLSYGWLGIMWAGILAIALSGYVILVRSISGRKPGIGSVGNRVERQVWKATGVIFSMLFVALIIKTILAGDASNVGFDWSLPIVIALYSVALSVSGEMGATRILRLAGYGAAAGVALTVFLIGTAELYLAAAAIVAATVLLPGVLMLRAEPSQTV